MPGIGKVAGPPMYIVYVLESDSTGRRYVGQTVDLIRRYREHAGGASSSTRSRGPWMVIHTEYFTSRREAVARERYLKSLKSRAAIDRIINRHGVEISA